MHERTRAWSERHRHPTRGHVYVDGRVRVHRAGVVVGTLVKRENRDDASGGVDARGKSARGDGGRVGAAVLLLARPLELGGEAELPLLGGDAVLVGIRGGFRALGLGLELGGDGGVGGGFRVVAVAR